MKKLLTTAAILASMLAPTMAHAASLTDADKGYITIAAGSALVLSNCTGYDAVPGSLVTVQDRLGVADDVPAAFMTALKMFSNADYDRADLVPDVTRATKAALDLVSNDLSKSTKKFCATYGKVLVDGGLMKKS